MNPFRATTRACCRTPCASARTHADLGVFPPTLLPILNGDLQLVFVDIFTNPASTQPSVTAWLDVPVPTSDGAVVTATVPTLAQMQGCGFGPGQSMVATSLLADTPVPTRQPVQLMTPTSDQSAFFMIGADPTVAPGVGASLPVLWSAIDESLFPPAGGPGDGALAMLSLNPTCLQPVRQGVSYSVGMADALDSVGLRAVPIPGTAPIQFALEWADATATTGYQATLRFTAPLGTDYARVV